MDTKNGGKRQIKTNIWGKREENTEESHRRIVPCNAEIRASFMIIFDLNTKVK